MTFLLKRLTYPEALESHREAMDSWDWVSMDDPCKANLTLSLVIPSRLIVTTVHGAMWSWSSSWKEESRCVECDVSQADHNNRCLCCHHLLTNQSPKTKKIFSFLLDEEQIKLIRFGLNIRKEKIMDSRYLCDIRETLLISGIIDLLENGKLT